MFGGMTTTMVETASTRGRAHGEVLHRRSDDHPYCSNVRTVLSGDLARFNRTRGLTTFEDPPSWGKRLDIAKPQSWPRKKYLHIISEAPRAPRSHAAPKSSYEMTPGAWPFSPRPTERIQTCCSRKNPPRHFALRHASSSPQSRTSSACLRVASCPSPGAPSRTTSRTPRCGSMSTATFSKP